MHQRAEAKPASHSSRPRAFASRLSADLAGRSVALTPAIPAIFDEPLAAHHKLIGRWAAAQESSTDTYTRAEARQHIERIFSDAVLKILAPIDLVDLRFAVHHGDGENPPAIAVVCDSMGQLDLGWIETSDAPISWRAAAYKELEATLGLALPVFGYQDLFEEISMYYWEGETDDEAARQFLIDYHGADAHDLHQHVLPSTMNARRPEWMIEANAAPRAQLPVRLRETLRRLRDAHRALKDQPGESSAWRFDTEIINDYILYFEDCSTLPPLTLVPFEHFARELDDVGRHGMENGFMDIAGICPLLDATGIDQWFVSLRLGATFLLAAQALIRFDPATA